MEYVSTRGLDDGATFSDVALEGLAPDGGLRLPKKYPPFSLIEYEYASFRHVFDVVFGLYAPEIPQVDRQNIIAAAYPSEAFGCDEIVPLRELEPRMHLLKLSEGPTLAFKDIAMRFLAQTIAYLLALRGRTLNIVVATSGDTGGAAVSAFDGIDNVNLFVLVPEKGPSKEQMRQMTTATGHNVHILKITDNFDPCQDIVKAINKDAAFKREFSIGAVNSINWARILAQTAYYLYSMAQLRQRFDSIYHSVPTGNFGNSLSCVIARWMAGIGGTLVCTNENDVLYELFQSGVYRARKKVYATTSPSMDITVSSNVERLIYEVEKRDGAAVAAKYKAFEQFGRFEMGRAWFAVDHDIQAYCANQTDVINAIREAHARWGTVIDPHTAVAMHGAFRYKVRNPNTTVVVAETAKPEKFPKVIREALGFEPEVPESIRTMSTMAERFTTLPADVEAVKQYIRDHV